MSSTSTAPAASTLIAVIARVMIVAASTLKRVVDEALIWIDLAAKLIPALIMVAVVLAYVGPALLNGIFDDLQLEVMIVLWQLGFIA